MKRIVIVEDDAWLAAQYTRIMKRIGYEVWHVTDGAAAIDIIDENTPDVILLDILLAQGTAPGLLHELQSHHDLAQVPVVLISNIAHRVDMETMRTYGVRAILDKATVTPDELIATVQGVV